MKKSKKYLRISVVAFLLSIIGLTGVYAVNYPFTDFSIPTSQSWAKLALFKTSISTGSGQVKLSYLGPEAVTFRARAMNNDQTFESFGPSTIINQTGTTYRVDYNKTYGMGTHIEVQVRNHNWTLSSKKISGNFNVDGNW